jgi:hypothetical protein
VVSLPNTSLPWFSGRRMYVEFDLDFGVASSVGRRGECWNDVVLGNDRRDCDVPFVRIVRGPVRLLGVFSGLHPQRPDGFAIRGKRVCRDLQGDGRNADNGKGHVEAGPDCRRLRIESSAGLCGWGDWVLDDPFSVSILLVRPSLNSAAFSHPAEVVAHEFMGASVRPPKSVDTAHAICLAAPKGRAVWLDHLL